MTFALDASTALSWVFEDRRSAARLSAIRLELAALPVTLAPDSVAAAVGPVFDIAARSGLSTYDATCLGLEAQCNVALATNHQRLRDAADDLGIPRA